MKQVLLILLCLFVLSGCGSDVFVSGDHSASDQEADNPVRGIYPFESAILTYSFVGGRDAADGTRTVYIDQWGALEAERIVKTLANDDTVEGWCIIRDNIQYSIDLQEDKAVKTALKDRKADGINMDELSREKGGVQNAYEYLREQNLLVLHDEKVAGYPCQVIDQKLTETLHERRWIYQGVPLKKLRYLSMTRELKDSFKEQIVDAQFNVPVDSRHFELPEGIRILVN